MKQRKQVAILAVLLLILVVVGYFYFDSDKPVATADAGLVQNYKILPVDNLSLHNDGVARARKTDYKSSGRNIFSREVPPPPPTKEEIRRLNEPRIVVPPPPVIPQVSKLPVKFFGYGTIPNGTAKRAFLSDGEGVDIVGEGDTLLGRFRIIRIGNARLEFEEIASGRRNFVTLDETAAPPS